METLETLSKRAKAASRLLAGAGTKRKNAALLAVARALEEQSPAILAANAADVAAAREAGMTPALIDRLSLTAARIEGMAEGVRQTAALPDPVGEVVEGFRRPNGLQIRRERVPLGVVGIIYEARPNVTSDAAALCLKAGNAVLLRGGKEAIRANIAIAAAIRDGLASEGLPADAVQLLEDTSRETASAMMRMNEYLDVLIPRGGAGLIRSVVQNATVPVIETGTGNCHIYVDKDADVAMAAAIAVNAKVSRPSVCNAAAGMQEHHVELRCCPRAAAILRDMQLTAATEEDWATEYLDYILAVRVVDSLEDAMTHIAQYGTGHSECIVTDSARAAEAFLDQVDAAAVYLNASTRFTDGAEFGLGAEIGISTQKLHSRGPMGLRELTTTKYIVVGNGQIR